jgi:maltooligosyltrehalose trehalohydrolase
MGLSLDRMTGLGASFLPGGVTFRVWAPRCRSVDVIVDGRAVEALVQRDGGLFEGRLEGVAEGARYKFRLDGTRYRPDPVSRFQPEGIHGPSVVVDPNRFVWTDAEFAGHAPGELVFYEIHVGAFTPAGTFEAVIPHLARLADLGVTALQLMPIAEFPGSRDWGYDGVHLFAPHSTYGGPRGLRRLVDACHARGLSVFLDVVYNHLGPEGNYLADYGPYFTDRHRTPWGEAVNFDGPGCEGVRRHVTDNGRMWVSEFHIDGFRLDAVHAIHDTSPVHVLTEFADAVRGEAARVGRRVHVVAESHDNDRRLVLPTSAGGLGLDAVWSDDFHHALHRTLTGETAGYYRDFAVDHLSRAIAQGFSFQGEPSEYWGRPRGTPSADLPGDRFVIYLQNHDQVGNRPQGERLGVLVPFEAIKLAAGLLFVTPAIPLIFMGEEYGETARFQFFTSFLDRNLAEAVRRGRAEDLTRFAWRNSTTSDPNAPNTFVSSRLNHSLAGAPRHRGLREYYKHWLMLRRTHPALGTEGKELTRVTQDAAGAVLTVIRAVPGGAEVRLVANLTPKTQALTMEGPAWRVLLDSDAELFGGTGTVEPLAPYQCLLYETRR